jgi:hypothetical protein
MNDDISDAENIMIQKAGGGGTLSPYLLGLPIQIPR